MPGVSPQMAHGRLMPPGQGLAGWPAQVKQPLVQRLFPGIDVAA